MFTLILVHCDVNSAFNIKMKILRKTILLNNKSGDAEEYYRGNIESSLPQLINLINTSKIYYHYFGG